jgi:hypothetical protein
VHRREWQRSKNSGALERTHDHFSLFIGFEAHAVPANSLKELENITEKLDNDLKASEERNASAVERLRQSEASGNTVITDCNARSNYYSRRSHIWRRCCTQKEVPRSCVTITKLFKNSSNCDVAITRAQGRFGHDYSAVGEEKRSKCFLDRLRCGRPSRGASSCWGWCGRRCRCRRCCYPSRI